MAEEDNSSYVVVDDYFVDWGANLPIIHFPFHVQEILYELALNYLINQPKDILTYCLEFFTQLKSSKKIDIVYDSQYGFKPPEVAAQRRNSVFAKSYDPQELDDLDEQSVTYPKTDEEIKRLTTTLRDVLFFKNLDRSDLGKIIDAMFIKPVRKGEVIIQQGDDGDFFYVVQSGIYDAFKTKGDLMTELCQYANNGYFGELALLYNQPRAASIVALTDGVLWALDRETFQKIVLRGSFNRSRRYESMIQKVPILMSLEPIERMKVADSLVPKEFKDGQEIVRQGEAGDGMYFIESGMVVVLRKDKKGRDVMVKELKEGDYFGELSLITKNPRACSVVANGPVKVAFLDVEAFERLLGPCMAIMKRNIEDYEQQLMELGLLKSKERIIDLR